MLKNKIKYILVSLLIFLQIVLGELKYYYTINLLNQNYPLISERKIFDDQDDNNTVSLNTSTKWLSFGIYTLLFAGITLLCIRILFEQKKYIKTALLCHLAFITFVILLVLTGIIFAKYSSFYTVAQDVKYILQTPFLNLLLIATFYYHKSLGAAK